MPTSDPPATKSDITALKSDVTVLKSDVTVLKGNLVALEDRTKAGFTALMRHIDKQTGTLHEKIDQVLAVLVNMDKRLTGTVTVHEKRITRLEEHTGIAVG